MRFSRLLYQIAGLAVVSAILAACTGSSQQMLPSNGFTPSKLAVGNSAADNSISHLAYAPTQDRIYVVSSHTNNVSIFPASGSNPLALAVISHGISRPIDVCLDNSGTAYVTNWTSNAMTEYAAGQTQPNLTVTKGLSNPTFCALDSSGNMWIVNHYPDSKPGDKHYFEIVKYPKGATQFTSAIPMNNATSTKGIAFDASDNLYVANNNPAMVQVFAPGKTVASRTITQGLTSASQIAIASNGTLYVVDPVAGAVVEYLAGSSQPHATLTQGLHNPDGVTTNADGDVYVSNAASATVVRFDSTGRLLSDLFTRGLSRPFGMAYSRVAAVTCAQNAANGNGIALASVAPFAVLAGSTVTNAGATTVNGNLGVSPGTAVSGFGPGHVNGSIDAGNTTAAVAQGDLTTAYNAAAGRSNPAAVPADIGGMTIAPGLYKAPVSLAVTGNVTLDAQMDPNAVFVFQMASTFTANTNSSVTLINRANACNVFWQVGSSATVKTASTIYGTILAKDSVSLGTGATLTGRALGRSGAVTLLSNTITDTGP